MQVLSLVDLKDRNIVDKLIDDNFYIVNLLTKKDLLSFEQ